MSKPRSKTNKVTYLNEVVKKTEKPEPSQRVVTMLEALLESAKRGEIDGAAVILSQHGNYGYTFAFDPNVNLLSIMGFTTMVNNALAAVLDEGIGVESI